MLSSDRGWARESPVSECQQDCVPVVVTLEYAKVWQLGVVAEEPGVAQQGLVE